MRRKDAAAALIGSALLILAAFVILPQMGIDILNPFLPTNTATVTITSHNLGVACLAGDTTTTVTFTKGRQLMLLSPKSLTPPEIMPAPTTVENNPVLGIYYPPCAWSVGGGYFVIHFEIPSLDYFRTSVPLRACCNPIYEDFSFNYYEGKTYNWNLVVYDSTGQQVYWTRSGRVEL